MATKRQKIAAGAARARGMLGSPKDMAISAASGGAAQYAGQMLSEKVDAVGKRWYGQPAAIAAVGVLLSKKAPTVSHALLGAAGYAGVLAYRAQVAKKEMTTTVTTTTPATAKGLYGGEAGALVQVMKSINALKTDMADVKQLAAASNAVSQTGAGALGRVGIPSMGRKFAA